ncbi:MAG: hypothetical protein CBB65_07190 [Hyphomonadaceae bacterium TMED5]|nr:MAG: hypothetical protein CBB65_07190 [Hyphomonadaceae bacterium TMED5]
MVRPILLAQKIAQFDCHAPEGTRGIPFKFRALAPCSTLHPNRDAQDGLRGFGREEVTGTPETRWVYCEFGSQTYIIQIERN